MPGQMLAVLPNPLSLSTGRFARISLFLPNMVGTYEGTKLQGPRGWPGLTITVVTNPAGGGGGPTWAAMAGTATVLDRRAAGSSTTLNGTVDAILRYWKNSEGLADPIRATDVHLTGQWSCLIGT
jgi:hypothetical protein